MPVLNTGHEQRSLNQATGPGKCHSCAILVTTTLCNGPSFHWTWTLFTGLDHPGLTHAVSHEAIEPMNQDNSQKQLLLLFLPTRQCLF